MAGNPRLALYGMAGIALAICGLAAQVPTAKPSAVDGIWLGELHAGGATLRVQLHVGSDKDGRESCTLDSLDQHAMGLECANVQFNSDDFSFEVPIVHGSWTGKLSADGNTLTGAWTQGASLPLTLARQTSAIAPPPVPQAKFDAVHPPATAETIQSMLDQDFADALKSGELAPSTGNGVVIAVVDHGVRRVFSYGAAKTDSIFEIGSISKTFTGLILSQMVEQGKVHFDDPVRELLPPGTVAKPDGPEITLLDLATQHSGLPRMPDNFKPGDPANPYADYHAANLYAYLAQHGVARPAKTDFLYSNLGFGLLGQALSVRAGKPYPQLLHDEVTGPLQMHDTVVALSPEQQARFLPGHTGAHQPAHAWDLDAFAGAGAIRSTGSDMLTYVEAQLHPDKLKLDNKFPASKTLSAALAQDHELHADAGPLKIALAWLYEPTTGTYWHNGATGGYSSYAFFNPAGDYGAVVLLNMTIGDKGSYADRIGEHIRARMAGKAPISLE
ncbi:MAG TPA: serine hydrolase [Terracidiphilus sp.]|nr:serine hydrolase [Terracidiphilus sp.]